MTALTFASLVLGTFVSEDLACIAAGLLIQRGELSASIAILACALGIFVGDLGLWAAGRLFGRAVIAWPWIDRQLRQPRTAELRARIQRHAGIAIVLSRFLPGTRLPLYLIAGLLQLPAGVFAAWALVASMLWTPSLVLLTVRLGDVFVERLAGLSWIPQALLALVVLALLHGLRRVGPGQFSVAGQTG